MESTSDSSSSAGKLPLWPSWPPLLRPELRRWGPVAAGRAVGGWRLGRVLRIQRQPFLQHAQQLLELSDSKKSSLKLPSQKLDQFVTGRQRGRKWCLGREIGRTTAACHAASVCFKSKTCKHNLV